MQLRPPILCHSKQRREIGINGAPVYISKDEVAPFGIPRDVCADHLSVTKVVACGGLPPGPLAPPLKKHPEL